MDDDFRSSARLMGSAGVVLRTPDGSIILVKPTYKPDWQLPGGILEEDESPRSAAEREVLEEIGLRVSCGRLLCVDYRAETPNRPPTLRFVFDGGVVEDPDSSIKPDGLEIERWAAVPPSVAHEWVKEGGPAERMRHVVEALASGTGFYLEDGRSP